MVAERLVRAVCLGKACGLGRAVSVSPRGMEVRTHSWNVQRDEVVIGGSYHVADLGLTAVRIESACAVVILGVVVERVLDNTLELVIRELDARGIGLGDLSRIVVGDDVLYICVCGVSVDHVVSLALAAYAVVICSTARHLAEERVIVVGEAAVEILEGETVLDLVARADSAAAELEAVAVAVAVALAVLGEAVAECNAVLDSHHADRTCSLLGVEVPAVVGVIVRDTAVEHIALSAGELRREAVGVLHSCGVAVVARGAVLDEVICRPLGNAVI